MAASVYGIDINWYNCSDMIDPLSLLILLNWFQIGFEGWHQNKKYKYK